MGILCTRIQYHLGLAAGFENMPAFLQNHLSKRTTSCKLPDLKLLHDRSVRVLDYLGLSDWIVDLILVGDTDMADMNQRYRKKKKPTDVLSFPSHNPLKVNAGPGVGYFHSYQGDRKHLVSSLEERRDHSNKFRPTFLDLL